MLFKFEIIILRMIYYYIFIVKLSRLLPEIMIFTKKCFVILRIFNDKTDPQVGYSFCKGVFDSEHGIFHCEQSVFYTEHEVWTYASQASIDKHGICDPCRL